MRLNPDCIRDILFYIEEHTDYLCWVSFPRNPQNFNIKLENDYPANVILYHLELCKEYGYIEFPNSQPMGEIQIKRLSVSGHEFLENITDEEQHKYIVYVGIIYYLLGIVPFALYVSSVANISVN